MNRYEELAHAVIDAVSEVVEELYDIEPKAFEDADLEHPALINGVAYYELENRVAALIRDKTGKLPQA